MKFLENGIEWEVIGRSGNTYRVQHKCSKWEPVLSQDGLTFKTVSVMVVSSRPIKEMEWLTKKSK